MRAFIKASGHTLYELFVSFFFASLIALVVALIGTAVYASEQDPFAKVTEGQPVCFGKEYSNKYLQSRPEQTVQRMRAKLIVIPQYNQKSVLLDADIKGEENRYTTFRALLICDNSKECAIECDGGRAEIELQENGQLKFTNLGIVLTGGCGDDQAESGESKLRLLEPKSQGDDVFMLNPLPKSYCQSTLNINE